MRLLAARAGDRSPLPDRLTVLANIGAHSLPLAQLVGPSGRVLSFEPTDYAYKKLLRNLVLIQGLSCLVSVINARANIQPIGCRRLAPDSVRRSSCFGVRGPDRS